MSFAKKQLKAARLALAESNFEYCRSICFDILLEEPGNYNALVFCALAELELGNTQESQNAYQKAIGIAPDQPLAYQGILKLYVKTGNLNSQIIAMESLQKIYTCDGSKLLDIIQKQIVIATALNDTSGICHLLMKYLPESSIYALISSNVSIIPKPFQVWFSIYNLQNDSLKCNLHTQVELERKRLGAGSLIDITKRIERELVLSIKLDLYLEQLLILDDCGVPAITKSLQTAYLEYTYKKLHYISHAEKQNVHNALMEFAHHLLDTGPSPLTLKLLLNAQNCLFVDRNPQLIRRVFDLSLEQDDLLLIVAEAYNQIRDANYFDAIKGLSFVIESDATSIVAHHLITWTFVESKDYDSSLEYSQRLVKLCDQYLDHMGVDLFNVRLDAELFLADSYSKASVKSAPQAISLYSKILVTHPANIRALLGLALSYCQIKKYVEAKKCIQTSLLVEPNNIDCKIELAWVIQFMGQLHESLDILLKADAIKSSYLVKFRLSSIYWQMGGEYRTDKTFTHSNLIQAIKLNPKFSQSFVLLGHYYLTVESDCARATKCYLKGVESDCKDEEAIRSLVGIYIDQSKISDSANLISKFLGVSPRCFWGWKQLGILNLHESKYMEAITSFQTALRINANDSIAWCSLGEAYMMEGKFIAALKSLDRALVCDSELITAIYLKANVNVKLGLYQDAIEGYKSVVSRTGSDCSANIPLIKNMLESYLEYSQELWDSGSVGACLDLLFEAVQLKELLVPDGIIEPCILFLLGSCYTLMYQLGSDRIIPEQLEFFDECRSEILIKYEKRILSSGLAILKKTNDKRILIECAALWFGAAIVETHSSQTESFYGACFHNLAQAHYIRRLDGHNVLTDAIKFAKLALRYLPDSFEFWNTLGICTFDDEPKLSQHSFIMSIEHNPLNVLAWNNLGHFYLKHGEDDLASLCFKRVQSTDPEYIDGWLGQAIIAGDKGLQDEMISLLDHAIDMNESCDHGLLYLYATECFKNPEILKDNLINVTFALLKCTQANLSDPAIFNMYGIALEMQGKYAEAVTSFERAIEILRINKSNENLHYVIENMARVLCGSKRFEESVQLYQKVINLGEKVDLFTWVGYGIALFFAGSLAESLNAFEKALAICTLDPNPINLMLSQVLFALGMPEHIEMAKQLLLQCFARDPTFAGAIINLLAMGIVIDDWTLVQTAAAELLRIEPELLKDQEQAMFDLLALIYLKQKEIATSQSYLLKSIHQSPESAQRWGNLAAFLCAYDPSNENAPKFALGAMLLSSKNNDVNVLEIAGIHRSIGFVTKDRSVSLIHFQKALRLAPNNAQSWTSVAIFLINEVSEAYVIDLDKVELILKIGKNVELISERSSDKYLHDWSQLIRSEAFRLRGEVEISLQLADEVTSQTSNLYIKQIGYSLMGICLKEQNDHQSAVNAFKTAISLDNTWENAWADLANVYMQTNDMDSAIECWTQVCQLKYSSMKIHGYLQIARLKILQGAFEIANESVNEVLKIESGNLAARFMQTLIMIRKQSGAAKILKNMGLLSEIPENMLTWLKSQ